MIKFLLPVLLLATISSHVFAGQYAKEANDDPFLNGELNSLYEGEAVALAGKILDMKLHENKKLYKLNLDLKNVNHIWVTSFIKPEGGELKIGTNVVFKGYISSSKSLDESGGLESAINSSSLLLAIYAKNLGE